MSEKDDGNDKKCFVIMPFSDQQGYEPGHFTRVYEDIISPGVERAGLHAYRGDTTSKPNIIHVDIIQQLVRAKVAICDLSSRNPNVMFELGIRQAFCLPTVLISDNITPDIFDVSPIRCMRYNSALKYHDVLDDQKRLAQVVVETVGATEPFTNSILEIAKIPALKLPSEINESQDVAELFQKILLKIDSMCRNPFGYSFIENVHPIPGLSSISECAQPILDHMENREREA